MTLPQGPNQRWSLDFLSDAFADGRRFRILAIVDDFTREAAYLVGGDKARADDILNGYVSLSEMPKEIRDSMMFKERADWVRTKADEYCKEVFGTINRPRRFSASSFAEEESDGVLT